MMICDIIRVMNIITIPKNIAKQGDLVIISRKEYEALLHGKKGKIKEITLTPAQRKDLEQGRKELKERKTLSIHDLRRELGLAR